MHNALELAKDFNLDENTEYACAGIRKIVETVGPRAPGSAEEFSAQQMIGEDLKKWTDSVTFEAFTVHRQAFMGFIPFTVACAIASVPIYWWISPLLALMLIIIGSIPLIFEFVLYKRFVDPLFKGHTSHNIEAVRKPEGAVKKRFVIVAHCDSQYEWTLNYLFGGSGMKLILIPAVVGLVVEGFEDLLATMMMLAKNHLISSAIAFAPDLALLKWLAVVMAVFIPFQIAFLFFQSFTKSVPGASDNLSGVFVGLATLKALHEAGVRFKNTEVLFIGSGSEEAGLRGSKDYVEKHREKLCEAETCVVSIDTFRDLESMAVYNRDLSGTLKHHDGANELVKNAAKNCGFELRYESIYIGGSDAASFTQANIPATNFSAMDPTPPRYYHTRLDNVENLNRDTIKAGIEVMIETVCMFDREGIKHT